jgi:hypothetical protein
MKAQFTKFGPKADYRGAHVTYTFKGRDLLGEIKDITRDPITGALLCDVRHMNGEEWPTKVILCLLDILERE